jgi:hypothetical protein
MPASSNWDWASLERSSIRDFAYNGSGQSEGNRRLNRRRLLRLLALSPLPLAVACGSRSLGAADNRGAEAVSDAPAAVAAEPPPAAAPPAPPFILPAGEERRALMAGTPYETPLYVFGSGRPGRIVLALGGVHGNEPGGFLAADRVIERVRPQSGALLVVPRANKVAISLGERTTTALADLNRSYPGFEDGLPMERMAAEISGLVRDYQVSLVHDMHESWAFYRDRTTNGTAFIGETISSNGEEGLRIVRNVIDRVNPRTLHPREEFSMREFPGQNLGQSEANANLPRQTNIPPPGRGTSSLGLNRTFPGLVSILVEMGQQQPLERRIALHVQVLEEVLSEVGIFS